MLIATLATVSWIALMQQGNGLLERGRPAEARAQYARAAEVAATNEEKGSAFNNVAVAEEHLGNHKAAERFYRLSINAWGSSDAAAGPMRNLATILWLRGDLGRAAQTYEKSLAFGETFDVLIRLARIATLRGRHHQAEGWYRKALPLAPNQTESAELLARIGETQLAMRLFAQAEQTGRQAQALAGESIAGVRARLVLGVALGRQKRLDEAASYLKEAAERSEKHYGPEHVVTACVYAEYAGVLKESKRTPEAYGYREKALAILGRRPERHTVSVADLLQRPVW